MTDARRHVALVAVVLVAGAVAAVPASGARSGPAATGDALYWSGTKATGAILFVNPQVRRGVATEVVGADCQGLGEARIVQTQRRYRNFRCPVVYRRGYDGPRVRTTIYLRTRTAATWCWHYTSVPVCPTR